MCCSSKNVGLSEQLLLFLVSAPANLTSPTVECQLSTEGTLPPSKKCVLGELNAVSNLKSTMLENIENLEMRLAMQTVQKSLPMVSPFLVRNLWIKISLLQSLGSFLQSVLQAVHNFNPQERLIFTLECSLRMLFRWRVKRGKTWRTIQCCRTCNRCTIMGRKMRSCGHSKKVWLFKMLVATSRLREDVCLRL